MAAKKRAVNRKHHYQLLQNNFHKNNTFQKTHWKSENENFHNFWGLYSIIYSIVVMLVNRHRRLNVSAEGFTYYLTLEAKRIDAPLIWDGQKESWCTSHLTVNCWYKMYIWPRPKYVEESNGVHCSSMAPTLQSACKWTRYQLDFFHLLRENKNNTL